MDNVRATRRVLGMELGEVFEGTVRRFAEPLL
jgi:hypothetical protein